MGLISLIPAAVGLKDPPQRTRQGGHCLVRCRQGHHYKNLAAHNRTRMHINAASKIRGIGDSVPQAGGAAPGRIGPRQCDMLCRNGHVYKDLAVHNRTKIHILASTTKQANGPALAEANTSILPLTTGSGKCPVAYNNGHHSKDLAGHIRTKTHQSAVKNNQVLYITSETPQAESTPTGRAGFRPFRCYNGHHYTDLARHIRTKAHKSAVKNSVAQLPIASETANPESTPTSRGGVCPVRCRDGHHYKDLTVHIHTRMHQCAASSGAGLGVSTI